ncbi:DNA (cytosine-5-)-methyltransferase [Candidatus Pacearchaeota archaeon]|nr:DNA (cytosine-5-)-methyltransferase [Candidatus Pacearchaeota archaeon]
MNILSCFDGMGCGLQALKQAGIPITNYFASEVDKYAIQIAKKNHPEIIELGDVTKWQEWDLPKIDLLIGGSPCQGFSFAGKQLNFDDPRSALFFEFVKIKESLGPKFFLLENTKMKQDFQDIISGALVTKSVLINSALVSAQNRNRLYWSNFEVSQPQDKEIYLKDIVHDFTDFENDYELIKISKKGVYKKFQNKASCLTGGAHSDGNHSDMDLIGRPIHIGDATDIKGFDILKRIYSIYGKSPTLTTMQGGNRHPKIALNDYEYRRLTPIECERLQTLPDNYTQGVSNTQRYKMLGNGWTVSVIKHIFNGIK